MSEEDSIPPTLHAYLNIPIKRLNFSSKIWLSHQLNPEKSTFSSSQCLQDWRGVAEVLGFTTNQIENFQSLRCNNPMGEVLSNLPLQKPQCVVGDLLDALVVCGRFDVLYDEDLQKFLEKSKGERTANIVPIEYTEPDRPVNLSINKQRYLTVNEAQTGEIQHFDAYICYAKEDEEFVSKMVYILEQKKGLTLCIPDRDLLPGLFQQDSLAELIKERCSKMIAVLSPEYLMSDECLFLTYFASSLEPGEMGRKLVPVLAKRCSIPRIISPISKIDFTKGGVWSWAWDRLVNSIKPIKIEKYKPSNPCILPSPPKWQTSNHVHTLSAQAHVHSLAPKLLHSTSLNILTSPLLNVVLEDLNNRLNHHNSNHQNVNHQNSNNSNTNHPNTNSSNTNHPNTNHPNTLHPNKNLSNIFLEDLTNHLNQQNSSQLNSNHLTSSPPEVNSSYNSNKSILPFQRQSSVNPGKSKFSINNFVSSSLSPKLNTLSRLPSDHNSKSIFNTNSKSIPNLCDLKLYTCEDHNIIYEARKHQAEVRFKNGTKKTNKCLNFFSIFKGSLVVKK